MPPASSLVDTMRARPRSYGLAEIDRRWSRATLRSALRSGTVARVLPGLYAASEHSQSHAVRGHAAVTWAGRDAALVGAAAVAQWQLCSPPPIVRVAVPWGRSKSSPPWLRLRRIREVPPSLEVNGVQTVLVEWALATAYGELAPSECDGPIYRAIKRRQVTPRELLIAATTLARVRHRRELLRVISAVGAGSESFLETLALRDVFSTAEFSGFIRQHRMVLDGTRVRLDMYDPTTRTAVELDGGTHADPHRRERDIERDAIAHAHGIATVRFSYRALTTRAQWCREVVRRTMTARSGTDLHAAHGESP